MTKIELRKYLVVAAGGFLGAVARYWLGGLFKIPAGGFPLGTFIINLSGSFILGCFLTLITEKYTVADEWRLFFATGFVGAYTTFSSFANEVLPLYRQNHLLVGLLYSFASLAGGFLCVWLGLIVARLAVFGRIALTIRQDQTLEQREEESLERSKLAGANRTGPLPEEEKTELEFD